MSTSGTSPFSHRAIPLREFIATEHASAIVLLVATLGALIWANSGWSSSYEELWHTPIALSIGTAELSLDLRHWINDGLMAFFFFVVGLEIRREFDMGELRERRRVAIPILAAVGGMVVPALIYVAINAGHTSARGWGIAMGTDTAFALGALTLVGGASPRARTFLLTVVIVDDIIALSVIALAYTEEVSLRAVLVAVALFGVVLLLRRAGVRNGVPYFLVGAGVWVATLASGVHATIAGVTVGLLATAYPPSRSELEHAGAIWRLFREEPTPEYARAASRTLAVTISPNERLQHLFHPWTSYMIIPLFALANAGIRLDGDVLRDAFTSRITIGIVTGLVAGKLVGIAGVTWLSTRRLFGAFPLSVRWPHVIGVGTVAGIGFTVSLLIADITFDGPQLDEAKVGILGASVLASVAAWITFRVTALLPSRFRTAGEHRLALPIVDLAEPVDPEVDHIRGPMEAPATLVEYGDFECPYCGRAEPIIRDLVRSFGNDLTFVFRHLPLVDVHERAQLAAEATEAAAAQGAFWPMHDALMAHQDKLDPDDLIDRARELGLDLERFERDLRERRHVLRVSRDVASADESGAAGTPTFFINGSRYKGAHDLASLSAALRRECDEGLALAGGR